LTSPVDVLESLGLAQPERAGPTVSEVAASLLERLPATVDELVRSSGSPAGVVAAALAELELAGLAAEGEGVYRALA
jgi:predicted Rossmann fold nucleotide-binding protein DprA/Smf involved in DNA uptake